MGLLAITTLHLLFSVPLGLISVFLILIILVQRGRGGGLTGALGGMGGQSAFGTKAGDLFTRITIVVAAVWILLSMGALKVLSQSAATGGLKAADKSAPVIPGKAGTSPLQPAATIDEASQAEPGETVTPPAVEEKTAPAEAPASAEKTGPAETAAPATPAPATESKDEK